jgi:hypothetical protein
VLLVAAAHTGEMPIETSSGYVKSEPPPTVPFIMPATIPTAPTTTNSVTVMSNKFLLKKFADDRKSEGDS